MAETDISDNLAELRRRIRKIAVRAGRRPDEVTLVAVSKTRSLDEVRQAIDAGQKDFGENTIQDAMNKVPLLSDTHSKWHFIGHLQSKKANSIPGYFDWVHSVDSLKLAQKLSGAMSRSAPGCELNCLIQVNVTDEASKSGLSSPDVLPFIEQLLKLELPQLSWRGLMTIGVQGDDAQTRTAFAGLRHMLEHCQQEFGLACFDQLSMGMSNDYPIAIEEGATMIRVGTAIFGRRNTAVSD